MSAQIEEFRRWLAEHGRRLTTEREFIAHAMLEADNVVESVRRIEQAVAERKVSRASAFRTLTLLVSAKLISLEKLVIVFRRLEGTVTSKPNRSIWFRSQLCESTHAKFIVGVCPWCGNSMFPQSSH